MGWAILFVLVVVTVIVVVVGFAKYGIDFIKHGFKQNFVNELVEKLATKEDIAKLDDKIESLRLSTKEDIESLRQSTKEDINRLDTKIVQIETNQYLKNYLGILNGVLLDKQIIDNEVKARLDNELRGM